MNNNILPILTILVLCYVLFCQRQIKEKLTNENSNETKKLDHMYISEGIKNLGIIANRIETSDSINIPINVDTKTFRTIINSESDIMNFKFNDSSYIPEGTIIPYYTSKDIYKATMGENQLYSFKFNLPERWVLCNGKYYKKYKYLKENKDKFISIENALPFELPDTMPIPNDVSSDPFFVEYGKYYILAPDMSNKIIIGADVFGKQPEINNYDFGESSSTINPYFDSQPIKLYEETGSNSILMTKEEIPKHSHYIASYLRDSEISFQNNNKESINLKSRINGRWSYFLSFIEPDILENIDDGKGITSTHNNNSQNRINLEPSNSRLIYIMRI